MSFCAYESPGGLVKVKIMIQLDWGVVWALAYLARSHIGDDAALMCNIL